MVAVLKLTSIRAALSTSVLLREDGFMEQTVVLGRDLVRASLFDALPSFAVYAVLSSFADINEDNLRSLCFAALQVHSLFLTACF